jgi:D-alanyl-D-alanine carboxypeptidase (penicillin-binding protein 5/6)
VVVAGSDTPRQRKDEARDLLEWGFARWSDASVAPADRVIGSARVQGGAARSVELVAPQSYFLTVRRGEPLDHTLAIRYSGPLSAPIGKGQPIADLVIRAPGQPPHLFPLVAAVDVPVAGFWARLRDGLLGLIGL